MQRIASSKQRYSELSAHAKLAGLVLCGQTKPPLNTTARQDGKELLTAGTAASASPLGSERTLLPYGAALWDPSFRSTHRDMYVQKVTYAACMHMHS